MRNIYDSSAKTVVSADGSQVRGPASIGSRLAVRTQVGWLSLSCLSRWRSDRSAIEERPAAGSLFPRTRRCLTKAEAKTIRARWRDRRAGQRKIVVRRSADANSSRAKPGEKGRTGNSVEIDCLRSAGRRTRTIDCRCPTRGKTEEA